MSHLNRQSYPELQRLRDFYEPLVILKILGPCIGPRIQDSLRTNISTEASQSARRIFLNRLSWICDYEPGGETVSAIAFERNSNGITAWLATSYKVVDEATSHLVKILSRLETAHTLSAGSLHALEQEICTECIRIADERVKRYTKLFLTFSEQCHVALRRLDPLLDRDLRYLADLAEMPMQLCAAADRFRDSESLKRLSQRITATTSPSMWSLLRHYIGRLGSWHRASRTLVEFARVNPEMFENIKLEALATPKPIRAPPGDEFTNLNSMLWRAYSAEEQTGLRQGVQTLQRLRHFDLDVTFQEEYRAKNFKPRVHAEAWLLEHFYSNGLVFVDNDKYIGCSKPSCYCCNLYFKNHPGGFAQRPCHGNVWTNWQSPLHQVVEKQALNAFMVSAMILGFREDLKIQMGYPTTAQARVLDSTTGLTLSNV